HMQADTVRFAYDRCGWLTAEHSVHGSIKYQRDALGNPTDITLPDGQHLSHLYYGSGHLLQTALDGITVSEYERDSLHRQVMRTQGKLTTFSGYNADNRLSWQRSLPGGSQNPQQTATHPSHGDSVTARDYIWNADGEVGGINDKLRGCLVFSYDRSGWLTSRTGQMYDHDHYYYDKAGNLLADEYQSAVMDNRLPGYGRDRYRYNEWGELKERRDQQLEWNAQGQLTRVISSNSETRYQYDALGRRISKATSNLHTDRGERSRTTFVWEGFRLLQETTWQGKRTYLYDAEQPYTPVAAITGRGESRKIWYYHTDLTGTVQEVTAADGTLVWAGYQAGFGENRGDISNSGAYFEQPLRLPGQYYDEETGLHYNLFRYYAPECGRFISQDPIGLLGGLNLYQYAPNPISWIDPLGLTVTFTDSRGLTLDVSGYTDLSHLSDSELNRIIFMNSNDAPHPFGLSPRDRQGNVIVLHHERQQSQGPITAMPDKHHSSSTNNTGQHPNGNKKGSGINNRQEFNLWKKEFWKSQAEKVLSNRGGGCV
ncbi:RHS domain-containing protein, partial [Escherichia coli]|nr:RHS domain-containing protein [Escherichia coli]